METDASKAGYGLIYEKNVEIPMNDGAILRCNVFRPDAEGTFPVIVAMSPYPKDIHFKDNYPLQWEEILHLYPEFASNGSSGKYLRWETVDPERWVPHGYIAIQIDCRGAGASPGLMDLRSPREAMDFYEAIEWAAVQPWSSGAVGTLGISYFAINQWMLGSMRPPSLKAMIPWEGASDAYRDQRRQGGILSNNFPAYWFTRAVIPHQNGNGATTFRDADTGGAYNGPPLPPGILEGNRIDTLEGYRRHTLDDAWFKQYSPDLSRIEVPLLSAGNWGGLGLHMRGNIEGYLNASSKQKWLEMHCGTHFEAFYMPEGVALQMRFFDHFLKGIDNGWDAEPPVQLAIRHPGGFTKRMEQEWPLARTVWTKFYLDAGAHTLSTSAPEASASASYQGLGEGLRFTTGPMAEESEFTGPVALRLWVSSSTRDMDIFVTLQAFAPDGTEVVYSGANDLATPISQGWLRVSHRKLDPVKSKPYRPYHSHDEAQPMAPDERYPVDVEILPTSLVVPKGYRLDLLIEGKDFEREVMVGRFRGSGPFLHNDPQDRPPEVFDGKNTLSTGGAHESYLLLPLIPKR